MALGDAHGGLTLGLGPVTTAWTVAIVDVENLQTGWKDLRYKTRRRSHPSGPRIRISGAMGLGCLKIRHARR
ncbi:hypothetical protein [Streptomyces sp. NPDC002599]|uniref:hypothetical protein n=1 Tax=Streptomyces sp. NPDC002599 TaxID=3154421 RepID=UPI003321A6A9